MAGPVGFQNGEPIKAIDRCGFRLPDHDDEAKISNERSRFKGVSNGMSRLRRYIRLTPREPASGGWIDGDDIFASIAVPPTTKTSTLADWLKQNKGDAMGPQLDGRPTRSRRARIVVGRDARGDTQLVCQR
jgi:hypothetical protein